MPLGLNDGFSKKAVFPHAIDLPHRTPTELVGLGGHFGGVIGVTVNANWSKGIVIAKRDAS